MPMQTYRNHVNSMYQAAPIVYANIPVAPPGLMYPMTLPGYLQPRSIQRPDIRTITNPSNQMQGYTHMHSLPPSIIPTREWLLDTLKKCVFTHHGILLGDYPKYEIQKKDIIDKFNKRIEELYPSDKYNVTKEWSASAMSNPNFLPEYIGRFEDFPNTDEFRIVIKNIDFYNMVKEISEKIQKYFTIKVESNAILETNTNTNTNTLKVIMRFSNYLIKEGQRIVFFVDQTDSTTLCNILIPFTEIKYQHDYLTYDGKTYSVLDTYYNTIEKFNDVSRTNSIHKNRKDNQDKSVDCSILLYDIVKNIRNGVSIFMAYADVDECVEIILSARNRNRSKKENQILAFDKYISPQVKLDYYIKIWKNISISSDSGSIKEETCSCSKCNVVIESDELVCTTKCCRKTIHPSCLLELYCHEGNPHPEFRCNTCVLRKKDKYGRNTEMLMGLCF